MNETPPIFAVSDALDVINQSLEYAFPTLAIVGEVANFKVNQGKWVFFDLKDETASLGCFMSAFNLRLPLENGMKVMILAVPKLTQWGKFSLTVQKIRPVGEGSIKKAFEILRAKLAKEGLFAPERKRALPRLPERIGVISSTDAAGYHDFIKVLTARFAGVKLQIYHAQVQGLDAPEQIIAGIEYFNESSDPPEVLAILRGGGSRDDLVAFDDESLVRKVAGSRVPIITGIGHEIDTTLADLAADVRASTPSNAAEILLPDRREIIAQITEQQKNLLNTFFSQLEAKQREISHSTEQMHAKLDQVYQTTLARFNGLNDLLEALNPRLILRRGYAVLRDQHGQPARQPVKGDLLQVETYDKLIETEVKNVKSK